MTVRIRQARATDWPEMRAIFLQGIATGQSSFETPETLPADWQQWLKGKHADSVIVAETPQSELLGWAALAPTSARYCYRGVAEVQLYIDEGARGRGLGGQLLTALIEQADRRGLWMLQAVVFPENAASQRLFTRHGFREVGRREKIARMNGEWRDTLLLERRSKRIW